MGLELSIKEVAESFGKHEIVWLMQYDIETSTNKTLDKEMDGPLGTIEISEKKVVCPTATFDVLEIRKHPNAPGWLVRPDPKSGILRCGIMPGGKRKVGLIIDTEKGQISYSFNVPPK